MSAGTARERKIAEPYKVVSITRSEPPEGASGSKWYTYVIAQGDNIIRGHRQGTRTSIEEFVDETVDVLNERRLAKPGRTHLRLDPKKKKKK